MNTPHADRDRRMMLRAAVESYFDALGAHDVTKVRWHEDITLTTPIAPDGPTRPLLGRAAVRAFFTAIGPAIGAVRVGTLYFSEDLRSAAAHATIEMLEPPCSLSVVDRFDVDDDGLIVEQENHFDPRPCDRPRRSRPIVLPSTTDQHIGVML